MCNHLHTQIEKQRQRISKERERERERERWLKIANKSESTKDEESRKCFLAESWIP